MYAIKGHALINEIFYCFAHSLTLSDLIFKCIWIYADNFYKNIQYKIHT